MFEGVSREFRGSLEGPSRDFTCTSQKNTDREDDTDKINIFEKK